MEERFVSHFDACMISPSSISTVVATIFAVTERARRCIFDGCKLVCASDDAYACKEVLGLL